MLYSCIGSNKFISMLSVTGFNRAFTSNWRMTLLTILAVIFFARLGVWQLERAFEKKQRLQAVSEFSKLPPMAWSASDPLPKPYQRLTLQGHFLTPVLLLDNQFHEHQFGYHVLSPFLLENQKIVLIDRGWVAGDSTRRKLPLIDTPVSERKLTGSSYYPSSKTWVLGSVIDKKQSNQVVIEAIDTQVISQFLHKSLYPFIIRLDKQASNGFVRAWRTVTMPPERHYAYAVQWFAMALLIIILFIILNVKKQT